MDSNAGVQLDETTRREELLRRFQTRDRSADGEFVVGVVTTGIYCLPSCAARKPRPENVRFFSDPPGAREAGLRACLRCRPDHFYRGFDPEREAFRDLVARVRRDPADFQGLSALQAASKMGATKLHALFRKHAHLTPAAFLVRERLRRARELLARDRAGVVDVAFASGFESSSTFHAHFRTANGMTPAAYRRLTGQNAFTLELPGSASWDELQRFFGRDLQGISERASSGRLTKGVVLDGLPLALELTRKGTGQVRVELRSRRRLAPSAARAAQALLVRWLGLESDCAGFERRGAREADVRRLVAGRRGLCIPRSSDIFEGLVWVIVGAQVNVAFAAICRSALIELAGTRLEPGFHAHPTPEQVAALDYGQLVARQFSRRKAEYLIDAARALVAGELDLEGLRLEPATHALERLRQVRGLGPWSVNYLGLRSYGFEDCAPAGDVALAEALKRFLELDQRPDPERTAELMQPFSPHRSLATYHLWKTLST